MKPIVFIHGYSAESAETDRKSIRGIYGDLPQTLRRRHGGRNVVEVDLSRYISLDDGIRLDDVSRGLHRVLQDDYPHLLRRGFHAIVHSTGALVIRNWLRRFSPRPSPLQNLLYLAGANFGSGWAHIGKGQFAKWGRLVFAQGERGVRILHALELGSDWTIDLHRHFLDPANDMVRKYEVYEHAVIGSQADVGWFAAPIRYAKEDGSDGVVRVAAGNLNFNYLRLAPTDDARRIDWTTAKRQQLRDRQRSGRGRAAYYAIASRSLPGARNRPRIPFAVPHACAHSGDAMGVVTGEACREQVLRLTDLALTSTAANWQSRVQSFDQETAQTYDAARQRKSTRRMLRWLSEPRAQYDRHAQVVLRIRDQDQRPVEHYDVFLNSNPTRSDDSLPIGKLIEAKHINRLHPNIICFYLRTHAFDADAGDWTARLPRVNGCYLEISATEPDTDEILYLPLRFELSSDELETFIQPHRTTVIDVELLRLPSPEVYRMVPA